MIITTTVRIYEYEKPQQFQCLLLSKIDVMDKWTSWTTTLHDIWEPIWMVGETTSSLKRTLKIAWRVRRWRSVNTKRGFLGCCGCSGESSFLLQAEKYREKRVFQQDSWNSSKSLLYCCCGALTSSHLKNGCLSFNFLSCPSVTKCNSFFTQLSSEHNLLLTAFPYRPFEPPK